jgi:hypothetical protein
MSDETLPPPPPQSSSPPPETTPDVVVLPSTTQHLEDLGREEGEGDALRPTPAVGGPPPPVTPVVVDLTTSLTDPPTPLNDEKPSPGIDSAAASLLPSHAVIFL